MYAQLTYFDGPRPPEQQAAEDPALLPGPDRIELYPVLAVHDIEATGSTR